MVEMCHKELEELRTEDFLSPNPVLCYGAGGAFYGIAPYLFACEINVVGVIDANKSGQVDIAEKNIPIYSTDEALKTFGEDAVVIITIANLSVVREVEGVLVKKGFHKETIFDMNVWTWLTIPVSDGKSYCPSIGEYIQFYSAGLSKCCNVGVVEPYICEWFIKGQPLLQSTENYLEKRDFYLIEMSRGYVPLYCQGCRFLSDDSEKWRDKISQFIITDHSACNADCVYCPDACSHPRRKADFSDEERFENVVDSFELIEQRQIFAKDTMVQLASGEITILPQREKLLSLVKNNPTHHVEIFSNCFKFDMHIQEILQSNPKSFLQCDLDAGTAETYIKVKGFNRFEIVKDNLKKYHAVGTVKIKYIILPGWNDSDEDFKGMIDFCKELELKELMLSPEYVASKEGDSTKKRELHFSTGRMMALCEKKGIRTILPGNFWKKEDVIMSKRFMKEVMELL